MHRIVVLLACAAVVSSACAAAQAAPLAVTQEEAKSWIRYLVPLPKSVEISSKVVLDGPYVAVIGPANGDKVSGQAVKELVEAVGCKYGSEPAPGAQFTIEMVLGGPEAEKLKSLKNSEQAYSVVPVGDNGLRLAALTSRGLYYASKTVQQLVKARAFGGRLELPLLSVTDWPDLEERGLWGGDSAMNIEWLADRKMNVTENISARNVTRDGKGSSGPKDYWLNAPTEGPIRAFNVVPAVLHLEQIAGPYKDDKGEYTLFDVYPMIKGRDKQGNAAICYSRPEFANVLADWIVDLKSLPNVTEVSVWLAENLGGRGGCTCEKCSKQDRNLLELRLVLKAWEMAQQRVGKFGLRVLTSEETRPSEKAMFAELPLDVKLLYYDSLFTYTTGKEPMINPNVEGFIKRGGWVAPVPNLSAYVRLVNPFTSPYFSHYRLNEFVDKGCKGLLGYACMGLRNSRFLVEGAAEWAWNAKGRTPEEFAISWAVRNKIRKPEMFLDWVKLNAPVAWDVYGSDFPAKNPSQAGRGGVAALLRTDRLPPLGWVRGANRAPWGQIKTVEQLDANVASAAKAVALAKEMAVPEFYYESLVVDGYIRAMKAAYDLGKVMSKGKVMPGRNAEAAKQMKAYIDALGQSAYALPRWLQAISGGDLPEEVGSVESVNNMIDAMKKLAADLKLDLT